jgi:hypothetical protein
LLERDSFDLLLPEFDKPWVIHLRETYCCSTNLCTWRPSTVYKNRHVRRHQALFWRRCRRGKVKGTHILVCVYTHTVYRRRPGSGLALQRKKMDLDWKSGSAMASGMRGFLQLADIAPMWEPSQEEEMKREGKN